MVNDTYRLTTAPARAFDVTAIEAPEKGYELEKMVAHPTNDRYVVLVWRKRAEEATQ